MNSALNITLEKRTGFEILLDMAQSPNRNEVAKAKKIFTSWKEENKLRFIKWYNDFVNSDFVTDQPEEESKEDFVYLINQF